MEPLYTAKEVSAILRVSLATIYNMMNSGEIKGIKIGRCRRFRKEDIQNYINKLKMEQHGS